MNVRKVEPEDLPLIQQWAEARGLPLLPELLSPYGFLAADEQGPVMAIWGYMILDVPIIQLDHLVAAPGQPIASIRAAWSAVSAAVVEWVRQINVLSGTHYCLIRAFVEPRVARESERHGWDHQNQQTNCIRYVL